MQAFKFIAGGLVVLVVAFFAFSTPASETDTTESSGEQQVQSQELTIETVKSDVELGAKFYDVRTTEEFEESHMEGAELFQLIDMQAGKLPEVDKDTKLYLYCRSGNRSAQAKALLEKEGYTDIVDLGGLEDVLNIGAKLVVSGT